MFTVRDIDSTALLFHNDLTTHNPLNLTKTTKLTRIVVGIVKKLECCVLSLQNEIQWIINIWFIWLLQLIWFYFAHHDIAHCFWKLNFLGEMLCCSFAFFYINKILWLWKIVACIGNKNSTSKLWNCMNENTKSFCIHTHKHAQTPITI